MGFKHSKQYTFLTLPFCSATVVAFGITFAQLKSFAQNPTQSSGTGERLELDIPSNGEILNLSSRSAEGEGADSKMPLEDARLKKYKYITTRDEACKILEGKIVTYTDQISLVATCKQHLISDSELLNELILSQNKEVVEIPASVYRLLPFGSPFESADSFLTRNTATKKITNPECKMLNGNYVTASGMNYYFVENCKKRLFSDYTELQAHSRGKSTIVTVTPQLLARIPSGSAMIPQANAEAKILYKIDGGITWSRLDRNSPAVLPSDSPESLQKMERASHQPVDRKKLCERFENKIVSFYSQIFFVENCKKRLIKVLPISLQQNIEIHGGVTDLTAAQISSIPNGKEISESDILKKIR